MNRRLFRFIIYRSKPGEIGSSQCWVCLHKYYMYTGTTLIDLLIDMCRNWKSDKVLVG